MPASSSTARPTARLSKDNTLQDNLIGVYADGPRDALIRRNRIAGAANAAADRARRRRSRSGTRLARAILDNDISGGPRRRLLGDQPRELIRGNRFRDLRFAVHFMYTNDSEVSDNVSVGNDVGYVMMYSDRLTLARQCLRPRPRPRPAVQLRERLGDRGQRRARTARNAFSSTTPTRTVSRQLVRGLPDRHPLHRRLRAQRDHRTTPSSPTRTR